MKNKCPFTPSRENTRCKDASLKRETATQRSNRLYDEWALRSKKLETIRKMREACTLAQTEIERAALKEQLS